MNNLINDNDKIFLLKIARETIIKKNKTVWLSNEQLKSLSNELTAKGGGFVTLTKDGHLRGCIGYILPEYPVYQTVIENAYNAAYSDPRFSPLSKDEINKIKIEISILTIPKKLIYNGFDDLLEKLNPRQDGVILKKSFRSSTFLPQVWEQLPNKSDFLSHLCMKAGLKHDEWRQGELEIEIYNAIVFSEEEYF